MSDDVKMSMKKTDKVLLKNFKDRLKLYIHHLLASTDVAGNATPVTDLVLYKGDHGTGVVITKDNPNVSEELIKCAKTLEAITIIEQDGQNIGDIALALKHLVHLKDRPEVEQFANDFSKD